jgi:hypothetical protein
MTAEEYIHHITCTEQDKHITSVNDSYCYLCDQTSNGTEIKQNGIELNTADVENGEVHQVIRIYIKCNIVFNLSFHQK